MDKDATNTTAPSNGAPSATAMGRPAAEFGKENKARATKPRTDGAPFMRAADGALTAPIKEAQRRFNAMLAAADEHPIVITRRGRRRAVVISTRRFDLYERALRTHAENTVLSALLAALGAAGGTPEEASLKTAEQALAAAKRLNAQLGGPLAPAPRRS